MKRSFTPLLLISSFLLGGHAILGQTLLVRELMVVFYGTELSLGLMFAFWLLGIALGSQLAGRLGRFLRAEPTFMISMLAMSVVLPGQVCLARLARLIFNTPAGQLIPAPFVVAGGLLFVTPFSALAGFCFPLICRSMARKSETTSAIGQTYVWDALGCACAGALFTFLVAGRVGALRASVTMGALISGNCLVGSIVLLSKRRWLLRSLSTCLLIAAGVFALSPAADALERITIRTRWSSFAPGIELLASSDSRYQNVAVARLAQTYSLYLNGFYASSWPDVYHYETQAHLLMTQHPEPKEVLLIGGGFEGLIRETLKHPVRHLDYVLLDPEEMRLARPYLPREDQSVLQGKRVSVHFVDGRRFVKTSQRRYDMVICNLPDPSTGMLNRFFTEEFYRDVRNILAPGGVFATSVTGTANYLGRESGDYSGSVYKTLRRAFPAVVVAPGTTHTFFASDSESSITDDPEVLSARYRTRNIDPPEFAYLFELELFPPERSRALREELEGLERAEPNRDFRPVTYFLNLVLWDRFSGSHMLPFFRAIRRISPAMLSAGVLGLLMIRLMYAWAKRMPVSKQIRFNSLAAIGTTGFAAIALEIILLFAYQSIYGYVYQKIGLVVALFMAGLALGGHTASWVCARWPSTSERSAARWSAVLLMGEIGILGYAAALPLLFRIIAEATAVIEPSFMSLVAVAGFLTGVEFPLSARLYAESAGEVSRAAGIVNSADSLGACLGALLAGVVLVPLLGVAASCLCVASMKGTSATLMLTLVWATRSTST